MRTFIALELPPRFADDTARLARQLSAAVRGRFMPRGNHHITLAFLGEVDEAGARRAVEALDAACAGVRAVRCAADGLGTFGRSRDATLWLGIARDPDLMRLAGRLRAEFLGRGLEVDAKPFRPHVTLARRARMPEVPLGDLAFPEPDRAHAVTLFRSTLGSEGATYKPLYRVELDG